MGKPDLRLEHRELTTEASVLFGVLKQISVKYLATSSDAQISVEDVRSVSAAMWRATTTFVRVLFAALDEEAAQKWSAEMSQKVENEGAETLRNVGSLKSASLPLSASDERRVRNLDPRRRRKIIDPKPAAQAIGSMRRTEIEEMAGEAKQLVQAVADFAGVFEMPRYIVAVGLGRMDALLRQLIESEIVLSILNTSEGPQTAENAVSRIGIAATNVKYEMHPIVIKPVDRTVEFHGGGGHKGGGRRR